MKLDKNKIYALVGYNGCGKSTLLNKLFKEYHDQEIYYVSQNDFLIDDLNVKQNLKFVGYDLLDENINKLIELDKIKNLYPAKLSLGQRQMVSIIGALYARKEIIFLDETMSGLNNELVKDLFMLMGDYVKIHEVTILIVSHQSWVINQCDEVINYEDNLTLELDCCDKKEETVKWKTILMFKERGWYKQLFLTLVYGLSFLFVFIAFNHHQMVYGTINEAVKMKMSSEVFIMNNSDIYAPGRNVYDMDYSSISQKTYNEIIKNSNIVSLDEYIPFSITQKSKGEKEDKDFYYEPVYVCRGSHKTKIELDTYDVFSIEPYTDYSLMDESLNYETSFKEGIILTENFLNKLKISPDELEDVQIELTLSIPNSQSPSTITTLIENEEGEYEEKDYEGRNIGYYEKTMVFNIRGILKEDASFTGRGYGCGYLPADYMNALFLKYNENYQPNAYLAKIKDLSKIAKTKEEIENLSSTLELITIYDMYEVGDITATFLNFEVFIAVICCLLIVFIFVYVLLITKKKRLRLYCKLIQYRYNLHSCKEFIVKSYIVDYILFMILFVPMYLLTNQLFMHIGFPLINFSVLYFIIPGLFIALLPLGVDYNVMDKK